MSSSSSIACSPLSKDFDFVQLTHLSIFILVVFMVGFIAGNQYHNNENTVKSHGSSYDSHTILSVLNFLTGIGLICWTLHYGFQARCDLNGYQHVNGVFVYSIVVILLAIIDLSLRLFKQKLLPTAGGVSHF
jgi:hypothetical protein